jgi:regulator of sigma E protease
MALLELVIGITVMIFLHELGHFLAARLFKVEVEEFGFGIPPRAVTLFTTKKGVRVTLNWLPLGGFVRLKGEMDAAIPDGLAASNPFVRIGVFIAGPLMNLLGAIIIYMIINLQIGIPDLERLNVVAILSVIPDTPAAQAGLQVGDIILRANDQLIDSPEKLQEIVHPSAEQTVVFEYQRGEEVMHINIVPKANPDTGEGQIGIGMGPPLITPSVFQAVTTAIEQTYNHCVNLVTMIGRMITGKLDSSEGKIVGAVGMYSMYRDLRQGKIYTGLPQGTGSILFFLNITVSLGLLNLLPVPALDGGRILLTLPEILLRRRVKQEYEVWLIGVSFLALIALLIIINARDTFELIK